MVAASRPASAVVALSCSPSGSTLNVQVNQATTSATPLSISVTSGSPNQYSVAIGATTCSSTYSVTTYSSVAISSSSTQYVLLDDSNGLLASYSAGCPTSVSTAGLIGTSSTVAVNGVSSPHDGGDETIGVGDETGVNGTFVTLSKDAGCSSPDVSLSTGVQTLVVNGGAPSANALDLSSSPGSLTVDASSSPGKITGFGSSGVSQVQFTGESAFTGPTAGGTTFIAPGGSNDSFTGQGSGNELDLSATSSGTTVNVTGFSHSTQPNNTAVNGPLTDTFSGVGTVIGSSKGGTTFYGGESVTLDGQGSGNTLDLSSLTATAEIDVPAGTASAGAMTEPFTGISNFVGTAAGGNTFVAPDSNATYSDGGTGNNLDLSGLSGPVSVNVSGQQAGSVGNDTAVGSKGTIIFTAGHVSALTGSSGGDTTFFGGPGGLSFTGKGSGNTLNLSNYSFPSDVTIDAAAGTVTGGTSPPSSSFSGVTSFVGASKPTTFKASTDSSSFTGSGMGNTLDLSNLTSPTVDASKETVTAGATNDSFTGINSFTGSSGGDTTFIAPGSSSDVFDGQGSGNELDLSAMGAPSTVNVSKSMVNAQPNDSAQSGSVTQTFNPNIDTVLGPSAGGTTFFGGQDGITLDGQGSGNTLDLSNLPGSGTIDAANGTASAGSVTESFNQDFATFVGSAGGDTTFISGLSAGSFRGQGTGNELNLTPPSGATAMRVTMTSTCSNQAAQGKVAATGSSVADCFSGLSTIKGASSIPTTFVPDPNATSSSDIEFIGRDSASGGSVVDLSGFKSPDSGGKTVANLILALGADTTGTPGHVTAAVNGTPVTFATFAAINEAIGSTSLTTGLDPGSASGVQLVNITRAPQAIKFTSTPPSPAQIKETYNPTATGGSSGNPVELTLDSSSEQGVCSISDGVVSFLGAGQCVLDANQAGNDEYQAAPQVQQKITVAAPATKQIAARLAGEIKPPTGTTIPQLLSHGASTLSATSQLSGTLTVSWYWLPKGAHLSAVAGGTKPVLVGRGRHSFAHPGAGTLRIKLTSAGRRLLKHHKRLTLTGRAKFSASGITPVVVTRSFRLRR